MTWRELAAVLGLPYDVTLDDERILGGFPDESWPRSLYGPDEGSLDEPTILAMVPHLRRELASSACCFYFDPLRVRESADTGLLFTGGVDDAPLCLGLEGTHRVSPTHWWPEGREWCVYTNWDLKWSYIGCSERLLRKLVADDALEVLPVRRDHYHYERQRPKNA